MWRGCRMRPPATRARSRSSLQPPRAKNQRLGPLRTLPTRITVQSRPKPRNNTHVQAHIAHLCTFTPASKTAVAAHPKNSGRRAPKNQRWGLLRTLTLRVTVQSRPKPRNNTRVEAHFAHSHRDLLCKVGPNAGRADAEGGRTRRGESSDAAARADADGGDVGSNADGGMWAQTQGGSRVRWIRGMQSGPQRGRG